jgi:hypothetical protein
MNSFTLIPKGSSRSSSRFSVHRNSATGPELGKLGRRAHDSGPKPNFEPAGGHREAIELAQSMGASSLGLASDDEFSRRCSRRSRRDLSACDALPSTTGSPKLRHHQSQRSQSPTRPIERIAGLAPPWAALPASAKRSRFRLERNGHFSSICQTT